MPWNETTKTEYIRPRARFESDLTDEEWILVEPCLPPPVKRGRVSGPSSATSSTGGKKVKEKRHLVVDVEGLPIKIAVHAASVQNRDGAQAVILGVLEKAPHIKKIWADGGYQGYKLASELKKLGIDSELEIVKKPKDVNGFTVLYRRWVVEQTIA